MLDSMHHYTKCSDIALDGKTVRLRTVVDNALETLVDELHDAQVDLSIEDDCDVFGDDMLLEHVVQNLIANSLKFRSDADPVITIEGKCLTDGFVEFSVSDNGIGIEHEYADKVFEMFSRLHNEDEYDGTGIGLAICKKIIIDHGGDIVVDKSRKSGTRMIITLQDAHHVSLTGADSKAA